MDGLGLESMPTTTNQQLIEIKEKHRNLTPIDLVFVLTKDVQKRKRNSSKARALFNRTTSIKFVSRLLRW